MYVTIVCISTQLIDRQYQPSLYSRVLMDYHVIRGMDIRLILRTLRALLVSHDNMHLLRGDATVGQRHNKFLFVNYKGMRVHMYNTSG